MRRAAIILILAMAGCASAPRLPEPVDWSQRKAQLLSLQAWRMTGRVAVSVDGEGASASIDWRQAGTTSDLALSGPLGVGALRAVLDPSGLSLEDGSGNSVRGDDAARVLTERLGTEIPLAALRYWVLGVPAPGMPAEETAGPDGRLVRIEQAGWQVGIDRYSSTVTGGLPARLDVTRDGARLKLVVSRWEVGP
jgi:outer membrane lipoprotein LolB